MIQLTKSINLHVHTPSSISLSVQCYLKNVIHTLIAHQSNWRSKKGGQFQHSFGSGLSRTALDPSGPSTETVDTVAESEDSSASDEQTELQASVRVLNRKEAELAMMAARGAPSKQLEPLTLFYLRDALMVYESCDLFGGNIALKNLLWLACVLVPPVTWIHFELYPLVFMRNFGSLVPRLLPAFQSCMRKTREPDM